MSDANIALNRFGYGARPDQAPPANPRRWLLDQFDAYQPRPPELSDAPGKAAVSSDLADYYHEQRLFRAEVRQERLRQGQPQPTQAPAQPQQAAAQPAPAMAGQANPLQANPLQARRQAGQVGRAAYVASVGARISAALMTPAPFVERLVHFWANHFAVSADKLGVVGLAGPMEFEAIRPHVLGKFSDMLMAAETHPAMLLYLDQTQSAGPGSPLGSRVAARNPARRLGLNENLAREIMELHTLGVRSVYSQADVTEFARALTGWTVAGIGRGPSTQIGALRQGRPGDFAFAPQLHEPGERTIVGKRYPAGAGADGAQQGKAVLRDLAAHPATARHIATKLARHFAGDTPPPALVGRLEQAFLNSGGDLPTVYRALVEAPEPWAANPVKFKTPWEWSVSAMRALGHRTAPPQPSVGLLTQLGQPSWRPGSPAGFDDIAASWAGPDAIMRRVEAAERFATRATAVDALALAPRLYPDALSDSTRQQLARAESPGQALALLLVSPEAMRR